MCNVCLQSSYIYYIGFILGLINQRLTASGTILLCYIYERVNNVLTFLGSIEHRSKATYKCRIGDSNDS